MAKRASTPYERSIQYCINNGQQRYKDLEWYDANWGHICALWQHLCALPSDQNLSAIVDYVLTFSRFQEEAGLYREMEAWNHFALAQVQQAGMIWAEVEILDQLARAYSALDKDEAAVGLHKSGLKLARKHDLPSAFGRHSHHLGLVYWKRDEVKSAHSAIFEALTIAEELKEIKAVATRANSLAIIRRRTGDFQQAHALWERALQIAESISERGLVASILGNLAGLFAEMGRLEEAISAHQRAVDLLQQLGLRQNEANGRTELAGLYMKLGQYTSAENQADTAYKIYLKLKIDLGVASALNILATISESNQNPSKAINYYKSALSSARSADSRYHVAQIARNLAELYRSEQPELAMYYAREALDISQTTQDLYGEMLDHGTMGSIYRKLGNVKEASRSYANALLICRKLKVADVEPILMNNIADLLADDPMRREEALAIATSALQLATLRNIGVAALQIENTVWQIRQRLK